MSDPKTSAREHISPASSSAAASGADSVSTDNFELRSRDVKPVFTYAQQSELLAEDGLGSGDVVALDDDTGDQLIKGPADADDILSHVVHIKDDTTLNSLTFRTFFLGIGMSLFGGTISTIYYFKPQTVSLPTVFNAVIIYVLGEGMAWLIPRKGVIGKWLNPHPFNVKEHLAILIMANSASTSATGIEVIAAENLYYGGRLGPAAQVFLLYSSQFLGYGLAGLLRKTLVYPKNMLWPYNLPVNNMLETLHRPKEVTRKPLKVFGAVFLGIFVWEIVPEWIFPMLTGFSIFCLAKQNSAVFTNVFGGTDGDEGLGLFSICFDWEYISGGYSPLYYPMESLISQGIGICMCVVVFCGVYYGNVWEALKFPFLSQSIFSDTSNGTDFITWNQTFVIGSDNRIDDANLAVEGLPWLAATYAVNILVTNMATTAAITHLWLWNRDEMKQAFALFHPTNIRRKISSLRDYKRFFDFSKDDVALPDQPHYDPHYKLMMAYKAVPDWWFGMVLLLSFVIAMIIIYECDTTLPWWEFLIAVASGWIFTIVLGSINATTGIFFLIQPIIQMIGGYMNPGDPVSNMYFSLYGYNGLVQGVALAQDLKLAQYGHLAPRVTFMAQMLGTAVGATITFVMTNNIITNQREVLLSLEGTNIWSGQQVQAFNSLAVMFGGLAHQLFDVGKTYSWITLIFLPGFLVPIPFWLAHKRWPKAGFNRVNTAVSILYISWLCVGINSSLLSFYCIGLFSQWFVRRRYPNLFVKYNYLVSAALDGGTAVSVFIMSFALFGAAGSAIDFPIWWGNNYNGNYDRCMYID